MSAATKLMTPGGGGVILTPASSIASDVTVNVPSQNCTLGIQGPAFSAYRNASQTITTATLTKIPFDTEEFDTANCYDSISNFRFTPNVAGYYQINAELAIGSTTTLSREIVYLFKNGSAYKYGTDIQGNGSQLDGVVSALAYANGTTDYFEIYTFVTGVGTITIPGGTNSQSYFQGVLVRSA